MAPAGTDHKDHAAAPSSWVARFAGLIPPGATALDLACGGGRHSRFLLGLGCKVVAVDRDLAGVADLGGSPGFDAIGADLEDGSPWPLAGRRFDAVVVTNYLYRPLLPTIVESVAPGGILVYETFGRGNERFGRPSNPDFLLVPGELLEAVRGHLTVVAYEHGVVTNPKPAVVQRLCAATTDAAQDIAARNITAA